MSEQISARQILDPETDKATAEFGAYIASRPYVDTMGNVHRPDNHKFVAPAKYFDARREAIEAGTNPAYEDMTIVALARKLGQAEFYKDRTSSENISDVLIDKLAAAEAVYYKGGDENDDPTFSDDLWGSIMQTKDQEIARLESKPAIDEPSPAPEPAPEPLPQPILPESEPVPAPELTTIVSQADKELMDYRVGLSADFLYDYAMAQRKLTELLAKRYRVHGATLAATNRKLAKAQAEFDGLREQANGMIIKHMNKEGASKKAFLLHSQIDAETENRYIALNTAAIRQDLARPKGEGRRAELTHNFFEWWVKQGRQEMSKKQRMWGHTKRTLAVAGVTIPVGVIAGLFLPIGAGAAIGAVVAYRGGKGFGLGFAHGRLRQNAEESTRQRAMSLSEVEANTGNLAVAQALQQMAGQKEAIRKAYASGKMHGSISAGYVKDANEVVAAERRGLAVTTLMGAGLGTLGAEFGHLITGVGGGHTPHVPNGGGHHPAGPSHQPSHPPIKPPHNPGHTPSMPPHQPGTPHVKPEIPSSTVSLSPWDSKTGAGSVWHATGVEASKYGVHLSDSQLVKLMPQILKFNHITDPRDLPVGYTVHFPKALLDSWAAHR